MIFPYPVVYIIDRLHKAGYSSYVVGGAVRDYLMDKLPIDYDLATAATPDIIKEVFSDYPLVLTGEKHGTVGIVISKKLYEITTFRSETTYRKHRWPTSVTYIDDLKTDLSRRDFTINAMALSLDKEVIDYFDGQSDLKNKIIRTVGNPEVRFKEDALRILRAFRFKSKLGFTIEAETLQEIKQQLHLVQELSVERFYSELRQILIGDYAKQVFIEDREIFLEIISWLLHCDLNDFKLVDSFMGRLISLTRSLPSVTFDKMLLQCKFTKFELTTLQQLRKYQNTEIKEKSDLKLLLNSLSEQQYKIWLSLQPLEKQNYINDLLQKIIQNQELIYQKELKINGHDLIVLDVPQNLRQKVLNKLYLEVINNQLVNQHRQLFEAVPRILEELLTRS